MENQELVKSGKIAEMLNNRFLSITIDDLINQPQVVEKLSTDLENAYKAVSKLETKFFDDEELANKFSEVLGDIIRMQNILSSLERLINKTP